MKSEAEIRAMLADVRRIREVASEHGLDDPVGAKVAEHTLEWVLGERE